MTKSKRRRRGKLTPTQIKVMERLRDQGPMSDLERSIQGPSTFLMEGLQQRGFVALTGFHKKPRWTITDAGKDALFQAWPARKDMPKLVRKVAKLPDPPEPMPYDDIYGKHYVDRKDWRISPRTGDKGAKCPRG